MSEAKQTKQTEVSGSRGLTAPDLELKRFIDLSAQIKALKAELDGIKANIKHQGTYSTSNYVATVTTTETLRAPDKATLVAEFGPSVQRLFKASTSTTVKVTAKGGA